VDAAAFNFDSTLSLDIFTAMMYKYYYHLAFIHHHQSSSENSVGPTETNNMNYRLQYRANSDKITASEEILKETRNIKLSCYRFASLLFNDAENIASVHEHYCLQYAQSDQY
jgi:hypothetical protein